MAFLKGATMARHLERTEHGIKEIVTDMTKCAWLYDEVCCNADSEHVADYPGEKCKKCKLFVREQ